MRDIDKEPRPFPKTPGTISESSLRFLGNFERLGWFSIKNPDFRGLFLPKPDFDLLLKLPYVSGDVIDEIHKAILAYEQNTEKIERGEKVTTLPLIPYRYKEDQVVRVGFGYPAELAPIHHRLTNVIICEMLNNPDQGMGFRNAKSVIQIVRDNLDVLNTLFGSSLELKQRNGIYFLALKTA